MASCEHLENIAQLYRDDRKKDIFCTSGCYYPIWPNLKDRLLGSSWTDSKCHSDICPCNICSCDICPYQEYISCYWFDFHQTLKVGTWNHLWQTPAVMETGNMCPGDICPYCEYLSCYRPKLFEPDFFAGLGSKFCLVKNFV